jgi:hypothetical protein
VPRFDSVKNLPVGQGDKGGKIVNVDGRDSSGGIATALWRPESLVEGIASEGQDTVAKAVKQTCERCISRAVKSDSETKSPFS